MTRAASDPSQSTSGNAERDTKVNAARHSWIGRLIDLSQRNNLLFFRPLKVGTLDLTSAERDALADLLSGKSVALQKLLPAADRTKTAGQAKEIARKAKENVDERGLETLYLAAGMATWKGEEGKRPPEAAVLLVPVSLDAKARGGLSLKRSGEPQINPVLLHVLRTEFRCLVAPETLLQAADTNPDRDDDPFDVDALLSKLDELASGVPDFAVRRTIIMGNFSFQKMAMVEDLRKLGVQFAQNNIIAGLAGDETAYAQMSEGAADLNPREFDSTPAQGEHLVLDADSSQQKVIRRAQKGQSLVIQGPPGTGKSQVITNLIVTLAAEGKRVMFVAEKRAALQVVFDRLSRCGLGHLALDLHGADTSRKLIAGRLKAALGIIDRGEPIVDDSILRPFSARREKLNAQVKMVHCKRAPSDRSAFELQAMLLRTASATPLKVRFRGESLMRLNPDSVSKAKDALSEAAALGDIFLQSCSSPWMTATFTDGHTAQAALDLCDELLSQSWPALKAIISGVLWPVRPLTPSSVEASRHLLRLAESVNAFLNSFRPELFTENLQESLQALQPASRGMIARVWATMTSRDYRAAKARLTTHAKTPLIATAMLEEVTRAAGLSNEWKELQFASPPREVAGATGAIKTVDACIETINALGLLLNRSDLRLLSLEDLETLLNALRSDEFTARRIPNLRQTEDCLTALGLDKVVAELRQACPPGATWGDAFEQTWLRSCLEHALAEDPALASFDGDMHRKHVAEFCSLDVARLQLAAKQVARRHVREAAASLAGLGVQATTVRREAEKKMRHLPFRKLMDQAPDVLAAIFPCFMCSPLSVSQLLPGDRPLFDVVIFDEASQVLPEDAVAALVRGRQAIIAGDEHQLPPTQFFASDDGLDGEETDGQGNSAAEGFGSLLSMMKSFVPAPMLEWHYRSRDERLIAFSNRHIYDDRLITFPGPGGTDAAITHVLVQNAKPTGTESDSDEVCRVVELILQHAAREMAKPTERRRTLGVIALGMPHARRVEAAVDQAIENRAELAPFFDTNLPERFFVKNLERVQGDERDVILLTLGISPDASGRVSLNRFGPLNNRENGYRRLNVAVTRSRNAMILVSAFAYHAIDVSKTMSRGMELLRLYLQYAASGGMLTEELGPGAVASNAFEADISEALKHAGINTISQWGVSRYRIDLVALHPTRPGRLVLAIECDGASYHSAPTARDRDRLRQQQLEARGWKFHRIWSTDWFNRRSDEVNRAVKAFEDAVADADRIDIIQ